MSLKIEPGDVVEFGREAKGPLPGTLAIVEQIEAGGERFTCKGGTAWWPISGVKLVGKCVDSSVRIQPAQLTKREEFAKAAMQGLAASDTSNEFTVKAIAIAAVNMANELIAELSKRTQGNENNLKKSLEGLPQCLRHRAEQILAEAQKRLDRLESKNSANEAAKRIRERFMIEAEGRANMWDKWAYVVESLINESNES